MPINCPRAMKIATGSIVAAAVLSIEMAVVGAAPAWGHDAIFVSNRYDVTAYPIGSRGNVPPAAVTIDLVNPNGIAVDASGRIYASNFETNTITVYARNAGGNVPPLAVIGGAKTRLANPTAIALDSHGKIYALNSAGYGNGSITVYPSLDNGLGMLNEAPIAAIAGAKTQLVDPTGIALDAHEDIYVANELFLPRPSEAGDNVGRITVYRAGSSGNVAPAITISGSHTGLSFPVGIAVDSGSNIYVVNDFTAGIRNGPDTNPSITIYSAGSNGNASPVAIIAGSRTQLQYSAYGAIALDSHRNLYVAGYENTVGDTINIFSPGSRGNVSPRDTVVGTNTDLSGATGFAFDADENLYVSNQFGGPNFGGGITVYRASASGNVAPMSTITSSFNGLNGGAAAGLAVDRTGSIYVANDSGQMTEQGAIDIYPPGSYATVPPVATIAGPSTGLSYPFAIGLDAAGNIGVLNSNNAITVYPVDSTGDVTPSATINIDKSGKYSPSGMAVGSRGDFYVTEQGGTACNRKSCFKTSPDGVAVYPPCSDSNAQPSAVISGSSTALASPSAVALDQRGYIYVTNEGPVKCTRGCNRCIAIPAGLGSITTYPPGSNGDVAPSATISGPNTGLKFPYGIALDARKNIYVLNATRIGFACIGVIGSARDDFRDDPILVFAAGSHGNVPPIGVIHGPRTGLDFYGSSGIAIGPAGP